MAEDAQQTWVRGVQKLGSWFKRAAASSQSLAAEAGRCGQRWFQVIGPSRTAFN